MDGMLSQDEINALLSGMGSGGDDAESTGTATVTDTPDNNSAEDSFTLTESEKDAVGEISNISMGTAATTLSSLLSQKVNITTPKVEVATWDDLSREYDRPCVMMQISYKEGLAGNNVLILKENDVKIITDLMMGGTGTANPDEPLSELHLSAIGEAMNQMMGSAATSLSSMLEKKVDISPPVASLVDLNDTIEDTELSNFLDGDIVQVAFDMKIGDLVDSQIMQLYPFDFARELYKKFMGSEVEQTAAPASQPEQPQPVSPAPEPVPTPAPQPVQPQPVPQQMQQPQYAMPMPNVNVQSAQFQTFNTGVSPLMQEENIDLVLDVPLEVTVELGRTNKSIKEILDFSPGTIIELDKLAGEPVDVLVNGKFVAKGEVVVIEENFGIRLVEISK